MLTGVGPEEGLAYMTGRAPVYKLTTLQKPYFGWLALSQGPCPLSVLPLPEPKGACTDPHPWEMVAPSKSDFLRKARQSLAQVQLIAWGFLALA